MRCGSTNQAISAFLNRTEKFSISRPSSVRTLNISGLIVGLVCSLLEALGPVNAQSSSSSGQATTASGSVLAIL
ncbi:hypothetical protein Plhal304r1_c005g0019581 [Plasmopara halstedii]